jgi:hypothetical protein
VVAGLSWGVCVIFALLRARPCLAATTAAGLRDRTPAPPPAHFYSARDPFHLVNHVEGSYSRSRRRRRARRAAKVCGREDVRPSRPPSPRRSPRASRRLSRRPSPRASLRASPRPSRRASPRPSLLRSPRPSPPRNLRWRGRLHVRDQGLRRRGRTVGRGRAVRALQGLLRQSPSPGAFGRPSPLPPSTTTL